MRHSIAAILAQELELEFRRDKRNRVCMDRKHEEKLSAWLNDHAAISVAESFEPWKLEETLVRTGPPLPLNIKVSSHPFKSTLESMRDAVGRD